MTQPSNASELGTRRMTPDRVLWFFVLGAIGLAVLGLVSTSSIRDPQNLISLIWVLFDSGPRAVLYLVASVGWGMLLAMLVRKAAGVEPGVWDGPCMSVGLGTAFMLSLSHLMGMLGLFGGAMGLSGRAWALGPIVIGGLIAAVPVLLALNRGIDLTSLPANLRWPERVPIALAWLCGGAILVVASANPPGALWASEFRGYDVLSYHLQLPKEWLVAGKLVPLEHNVYSYLPGYIEAAFMHLGAMTGSNDLQIGDGTVLLSSQLLVAGITALAAWSVGRAGIAAARAAGARLESSHAAGAATAAAAIVVPWLLVVGSMAYNESAVVLLLAAACAAALMGQGSPANMTTRASLVRGAVCGVLVGAACGAKPTAIFMGAPIVGLMLLWKIKPRGWWAVTTGACIAGLLSILPWLIRNHLASGNPVFPQLAGMLGSGHWSMEQVERYMSAHRFEGSWLERLKLMVVADASDPAGVRHRGFAHAQWAWFFPVSIAACVLVTIIKQSRQVGLLLLTCLLVQTVAWLGLTHIQSRFLIPLMVPALMAMAVMAAIAWESRSQRSESMQVRQLWPAWAGSLLVLMLWALVPEGAYAVHRYLDEGARGEGPNGLLTPGPGVISGTLARRAFEGMVEGDQRQFLTDAGPIVFCNFTSRPGDLLYMLGDATPLYHTEPVVYNTTYDTSLLGEAIAKDPESPGRWIDALHKRGVTRVLVNYSELARLGKSGWLDARITPEAVERSIAAFGQVERTWGEQSLVLYRIK
jgi:general stress protein CsbA